ncbi:Ctr copper transporter family-domain-containing protein [Aspergillus tetrazonus]
MEHAHSTLLPRMAGMDMSSSATNASCSVEMLWNWNVIDSCFLSSTWHVTTKGMFAVSCIGVALLGVALEFLRRVSKDYEESLQRQFQRHAIAQLDDPLVCGVPASVVTYRASPLQQIIRAVLHVAQFGVAYITMLIAMYYNGYMIISIFIGAFLGKLFFDWGQYKVVLGQTQGPAAAKVEEEVTKCCG